MRPSRRRGLFSLRGAGVVAAAALASLSALAGVASPAGADTASTDAPIVVRSVDTRTYEQDQKVTLTVLAKGSQPAQAEYQLDADKKPVQNLSVTSFADAKVPVGVVFVIDTSQLMDRDGAIDQVRTSLNGIVGRRTANEKFAIVASGVNSRVVTEFTSDPDAFKAALDTVRPTTRTDSSLTDAMQTALNIYRRDTTNLQPNIVVVTASSDDASTYKPNSVKSALEDTATLVFGVALRAPGFDASLLSQFANGSGGGYLEATTAADVANSLSQIMGFVRGQQVLSYTGQPKAITADIVVTARTAKANAYVTTGTFVQGPNVNPPVFKPVLPHGPGFLRSNTGKYVAAAAALLAVGLLVLAVGLVVFRDRTTLDDVLQLYAEDPRRRLIEEEDDADKGSFASTNIMKRAVALTGSLAQRRGILIWVESALEQADLPLRAAEALLVYAAGSVLLVALLAVITHKVLISLIMLLLVLLAPPAILNFLAGKRKRKFTGQLPDTLSLISGSLKAGYSLMQGLEAVSQEVSDPMGRELRRIVIETQLGRPVEESLEESAARMQSPDFAWAVMAIRIQREVGGNLAELLTTVGETMIARERLGRDVRSLTAEGRMSAIVIGVLPVVLGIVMWMLNPKYIGVLFQQRLGNVFLGLAVVLMLFGFWWMKKTIEIEV